MDAIKDIIPRVIAPLSKGAATPFDIGQWWMRHHGKGKTSGAADLKDGVLTVNVDCAARRVKMDLKRLEYLDELKKEFPAITNIRFKVGKVI